MKAAASADPTTLGSSDSGDHDGGGAATSTADMEALVVAAKQAMR